MLKMSFLNGDLQDKVYMASLSGVSHDSEYVCKLKKALYGVKQAPRAWFEKFSTVISCLQFVSSSHDSALFVKYTDAGRIILFLYIDDMIIIGDDIDGISILKTKLAKQFEMKDLDYLRYFLSIKVAYSPRDYLLSQSKYVADILKQARLTDNKTVDTLIEVNARYSFSDSLSLLDPTLYRAIVGSLVYLTITHPDIAYVVHVIGQFIVFPTTVHWAAILCILRYLRDTVFHSLLLPSTFSLELHAYHPPFPWSYMHTLMLIMVVISQIASLLLVYVSF